MATNVDKVDSELKKVHAEMKKLAVQLKKGSDPKIVKQIRDLMIKYTDSNIAKAYAAAADKDAKYWAKTMSDINPGIS